MWRMFIKENEDRIEKVAVNQETGEFMSYKQSMDGYLYSVYKDNIMKMGWKSVREFLQKKYRYVRYTDPRRGIKRAGYMEVDYDTERKREVDLLLHYGTILMGMQNKAAESRKHALAQELDELCSQIASYGEMSKEEARTRISELASKGDVSD